MQTRTMKMTRLNASALALALFAAVPASAATYSLNFDNVATGATANSAAPLGISFHQAHWVNDVDEYGDEIPGTEKWQIDTENDALFPVTLENPALNDYGSAPSGVNALDARWQPVLVRFDTAKDLNGFSLIVDNSTYGNLGLSSLYFLGADKSILGQLDFDQTIPGLSVSLTTPLYGVQEVLLSSGAFYDNITVSEVPVPAAAWLMGSALLGLGGISRRRMQHA